MTGKRFSKRVSVFQESRLPEAALPVGYAALIDAYDLDVPRPRTFCAIGVRHKVYEKDGWRLYTPRHEPAASLEGHLVFALKYEGLDLCILKRLFEAIDPSELAALVRAKPASAYMRRLWFLYEWLLKERLDAPDAATGNYAEIVDRKLQWAVEGSTSTRHRVRNNLPGTPAFCPMVFRTDTLKRFVEARLDARAHAVVGRISAGILARTAAFLLLKDSKSSYAIEGEAPPQDRVQRWGKAIGEAGQHPLDRDEFLRLQRIVIGDERFVRLGFRTEGGFVGGHDRDTRMPLPDHISARPEDLPSLVQGLIDFDRDFAGGVDPVIAASILSFGFVYIHPFEDGNGRIHRYLIHHVLSARGFNPPGMVFPVSAAILERIDDYRRVLESYSQRLLPHIRWEPTERMNVRALNDTADFYRYFDATPHAEYLFGCVQKTIESDLPEEAAFLERYDQFKARVEAIVEMPASLVDLLFNFLRQNGGVLSKRAREREFAELTEREAAQIEEHYQDIFPN
ncbi:MAG: Fic family protein [Alphaproteobacteria bacterium]|nr:Fic family protein [Alphaproteobacteria bacterium]